MIVLDASLATKFVISEPDSADADRWYLNVGTAVVAPDLIAIEVAQAVVRRVNARQAGQAEGRRALQAWSAILASGGVGLFRTSPTEVEEAARIALQLEHPVKDCIYLTLALQFECGLVTCDTKFAAKARATYPNVRLLDDYA